MAKVKIELDREIRTVVSMEGTDHIVVVLPRVDEGVKQDLSFQWQ